MILFVLCLIVFFFFFLALDDRSHKVNLSVNRVLNHFLLVFYG